ncbi:PepSY-associated TM helix domain-containing protein [Marivirga sp.]|uniref:PepSY-associated TM helix domain-containing protein n=1 Tax=Marivirga sp. TaxID=2018662 RepID=UPI003DA7A5D0
MGKSSTKKFIRKIHLVLGLISGIVIFLSILPASIFVWEEELTKLRDNELIYVKQQQNRLELSELVDIAKNHLPSSKELSYVSIYNDPTRSVLFETYKDNENPGLTFFSEYEYWDKIYLNPYSGEILGETNMIYDWIYLCRVMHQQLLLNYEIGHWPVGIATLIMFAMLISGLYLWWPKKIKNTTQRLKIKWNAKWRRLNFDLHSNLGFYSIIFILFFAITGLVWSFDWWTNGIYRLLGTNSEEVFKENYIEYNTDSIPIPETPIINIVYEDVISQREKWLYANISFPNEAKENPTYSVYLPFKGFSGWDLWDTYTYNADNGKMKTKLVHEDKSTGEKWRNSNYAWHVGSIFGWPTKVLASIISIICASLPITGFLLWYGRNNKKNKKTIS